MEALFLKILNMSLSAAAVIVVVLLVRLALRRAPKKWSYLLWAVVAFRLLCPVSFSAPFSVLRLATQPAAVTETASAGTSEIAYIPQNIGNMAQPRVYVGTPAVSEAVSQSLPAATPMDSANPLQIWIAVGTGLWFLGMAALLIYGILSYVNLRRRLRDAVRLEAGTFETDAVRSPFILGLFYPTIYLPAGLSGEPLRYVLAHERFHIRRGDHAVKLLAFALLCVHWFNPLVWLAFCLMSRDMEMRCDEAVLAAESGITKPYSMALLSFATARHFPSPSPLCFGESGVKGRIRNVLRWKKPRVWVTVLCALLCAVAVAACAANPGKEDTERTPTGTPWDWTSTVSLSDINGISEGRGITLKYTQMKSLVDLLNAVQPEEVVRGRGIPSQNVLDISSGIGYRLRWAGGIIELDFDDSAAAAELYGIPDTLSPGVWEIHNDALYAFLEGLQETGAEMPKVSWRDLYLDFFNSLNSETVYGVALIDANFDTVPELIIWDGAASSLTHGTLYRFDGTHIIKASEYDYRTSILDPHEAIRAFWLVRDRTSGSACWVYHNNNGQGEHGWGGYYALDGSNSEIAAYDAIGVVPVKEAMNAAWDTFSAQYEVLNIDYSDFTLSVFENQTIDAKHFAGLLDNWRPLRPITQVDSVPDESLRALAQSDPERFAALMEGWNAEVNMIGEQFVSEAGEAGNWWDIPEAFANRWCRNYLNASEDNPFRCSDGIIWRLADYLNDVSLTSAPRRLAFNVTLALGLPAEREEDFVFARAGWATKNEHGMLEISTEAVLRSDDGVRWTVEALNSGGSAGWGFRTLEDSEQTDASIHNALEIKEPTILLRLLPNMDWDKLSGEEIKTAMELLLAAAVSDDPAYLNGQDQLIRDVYMLWGVKRADGAYAEIYLDGPGCILDRQRRADPEAFEAALAEMDAVTQRNVRLSMQHW